MKALAWVGGLALLAVGVLLLRAELMTVELGTEPGSRTDFVVQATSREDEAHLTEMTRGLVSVCRLLVNADVAEQSFRRTAEQEYAFTLVPGLDEFDLREMRGCLSDARVQHLLVDVVHVETTQRTGRSANSA